MTNNSLNTTNNIFKELSIQIAMNGLSFSVRNTTTKELLEIQSFPLEKIYNEQGLLDNITDMFNSDVFLNDKYDSIAVTHVNNSALFVPNALFEIDNLADYLKFSVSLEEQPNIAFDEVNNIQAKVVFLPFTRINNFLFEKLGSFDFGHHSQRLLDFFLNKNQQNSIKNTYLFFRGNTFDCFILQNNKLIFYNNFTFQNEADVLYFLLFTYEQFKLKQAVNPLIISGDLKENDKVFNHLKKYFNHLTRLQETSQNDITKQQLLANIEPILS